MKFHLDGLTRRERHDRKKAAELAAMPEDQRSQIIEEKKRKRREYLASRADHYKKLHREYKQRPDVKERRRIRASEIYHSLTPEAKQRVIASMTRTRDKKRRSERDALRRRSDPAFRLGMSVRTRLYNSLKADNASKKSGLTDLLGCTVPELKKYLESRFHPGMTWENWSRTGWHIDHIKPLALFDLNDPSQISIACHYANLQPLWASENVRKNPTARRSDRFIQAEAA